MSSSPIDYRRPSRPRRGPPSRIPKPQFTIDAAPRGGTGPGPSGDPGPRAPPSTPRPPPRRAKLDAAFAAAVDPNADDTSWLIAAGAGAPSASTDSLLEAAEWRECEDDGRSLHSYYDDGSEEEDGKLAGFDVGMRAESNGSWSPAAEGRRGWAALEAAAARLGRLAWTLEWVAALRVATPHTPPAAAAPAAPSGGSGGSCRSLSAAFERAATEPAAFQTCAAAGAGGWGGNGSDDGSEDFASACSASVAGGSEASDADSEELHASLGTSVSAAAAASDWLSGGDWGGLPP